MAIPEFTKAVATTAIPLCSVLAPVACLGILRRSREIFVASIQTLLLGLVQSAIIFAPSIGWFATLQYNWLQKAFAFACAWLWAKASGIADNESGFSLPKSYTAFALGLGMGVALGLFDFSASEGHSSKASVENLLFQLTMPGLQEEALYRGVMLYILDKHLGCPWRVLGVQIGWGCLITTTLFTLGHVMALDTNWHPIIEPHIYPWIDLIVFALAMCWLRYKVGSIWPAVLAHNACNSVSTIASQMMP